MTTLPIDSYWNQTTDAWDILTSNFNIVDWVPFFIFAMCVGSLIMIISRTAQTEPPHSTSSIDIQKKLCYNPQMDIENNIYVAQARTIIYLYSVERNERINRRRRSDLPRPIGFPPPASYNSALSQSEKFEDLHLAAMNLQIALARMKAANEKLAARMEEHKKFLYTEKENKNIIKNLNNDNKNVD